LLRKGKKLIQRHISAKYAGFSGIVGDSLKESGLDELRRHIQDFRHAAGV
jgi:hypothetical protein